MISENFPYKEFMDTPIWHVVQEIIMELHENNDFELLTDEGYVIGAICKHLFEKNVLLKEVFK